MAKVKDTSVDFDDCVGKVAVEIKPGSLADFLGVNDVPRTEKEAWEEFNYKNAKEHWRGMPACENEDLRPAKQLQVNFKSEDDMKAFMQLIGQQFTPKTKSIWYPAKIKDTENALRRYLDEGDL